MSVSVQKVKVQQAQALAEYYAKKADELVEEMAADPENRNRSPEELMVAARVQIARDRATQEGGDPDKAEAKERAVIRSSSVGGSTAYYAAPEDEIESRRQWIRGDQVGETVDEEELEQLFLGEGQDAKRLDDPRMQTIQKAARMVGFEGDIDADVVAALRSGVHPETGEILEGEAADFVQEAWAAPVRKGSDVTASDLTFSAPKGVSLLAAFCDEETSEEVIRSHEEAIENTLKWAEDNGIVTARRRVDGEIIRQSARLDNVARVTEMTSREGDPQLHSHTIMSAFVTAEDGRRTAMDLAVVHNSSAILDAVYRRSLSQNLQQSIGVGLTADENGKLSVVPGIDRELIQKYSTRRQQINETLEERTRERERLEQVMGGAQKLYEDAYRAQEYGDILSPDQEKRAEIYDQWLASGTTPAAAALATRQSKEEETEAKARARWAQDVEAPDGSRLLKKAQAAQPNASKDVKEGAWAKNAEAKFHDQLSDHLTQNAAGFSAKEAWAAAIHLAPQELNEQELQESVERYLKREAVLMGERPEQQLGDVWMDKTRRFTTTEVVQEIEEIVDRGKKLSTQSLKEIAKSDMKLAARMAESYNLSEDQEKLFAGYLTGQRLVMTEGPAGSGKSHVLGLISEHARGQGSSVTVLSTKADLASELAAEVGADRGMSLTKATMREEDFGYKGVFEAGYWAQGLTEEQANEFHEIKKLQREATTARRKERADKAMEKWVAALPDKSQVKQLARERSMIENTDKVAKFVGAGKVRQRMYDERLDHLERRAENPDVNVKIDHDEPHLFIVDEAAMSDNQNLDRLLEYAEEHESIQVVMVGDSAQLSAVGRAGGYRALADELDPIELNETRRAKAEWEREAQLKMRSLEYDEESEEVRAEARNIVATYEEEQRIDHVGEDEVTQAIEGGEVEASVSRPDLELAAKQATDWYMEQQKNGEETAMVLTPTKALQAQVAEAIQERRMHDPEDEAMKPDAKLATLKLGENISQSVQKGEPVTIRENITRKGLRNGMQGEVVSVGARGGVTIQMTDERGRTFKRSLSKKELDEGKLALAYTSTSHKAQGSTVDRALYIHDTASEFADRHMVYPSVTRGRSENRVLLVGGEREEALESLAASMHRSNDQSPVRAISMPVTEQELTKARSNYPSATDDQLEELIRNERGLMARRELEDQQERRNAQLQAQKDLAQARARQRGVSMAA